MIEKIEVFVASCDSCSLPFPDDAEPVALSSKEELIDHIKASDWNTGKKIDYRNEMHLCPRCQKKEKG